MDSVSPEQFIGVNITQFFKHWEKFENDWTVKFIDLYCDLVYEKQKWLWWNFIQLKEYTFLYFLNSDTVFCVQQMLGNDKLTVAISICQETL